MVVAGDRAPTFTVFRLSNPDRLVIDLSTADASAIKGHHDGAGPISGIVAAQFSDAKASVARLLLALQDADQYDVRSDGHRIVIRVDGGAVAARSPVASAPPIGAPSAPAAKAASPAVAHANVVPSKPVVFPAAKRAAPALGENVVAAEVDERKAKRAAKTVTGLTLEEDGLHIQLDGEIARFELLQLENPPRLALDLFDMDLKARGPKGHAGPIRYVRAAEHGGKVRLVLDARDAMPAYFVSRRADGLDVLFGAKASAPAPLPRTPRSPKKPFPPVPVKALEPSAAAVAQAVTLKDLLH